MIANANLEEVIKNIIDKANLECDKTGRNFSWGYKSTNEKIGNKITYVKSVIMYVTDINIGERIPMIEQKYRLRNSTEAMKINWKKQLLIRLLTDIINFFLINFGDHILVENSKKFVVNEAG